MTSVFTFDPTPFAQRLRETIEWCAAHVRADDPMHSLRSEVLRPNILAPDRASMVNGVVTNRALRTREGTELQNDLAGGRLLIYYPDASLADGAAETQSRGFFDVHNVPPWDCWIALAEDREGEREFRQYVVAWVPPVLQEYAEAGIEVNPEGCVCWLDVLRFD